MFGADGVVCVAVTEIEYLGDLAQWIEDQIAEAPTSTIDGEDAIVIRRAAMEELARYMRCLGIPNRDQLESCCPTELLAEHPNSL